jgi:hypothetical protein
LSVTNRLSFLDSSFSNDSEYQDTVENRYSVLASQYGQYPIPPESENMRNYISRQLLVDSGSSISHWNKLSSIVKKAGSLKISNLMKRVQETKLVRNCSTQRKVTVSSLGNSRSTSLGSNGIVVTSEVSISSAVLTSALPLKPITKSKILLWRIYYAMFILGIRLGYLCKHVKEGYLKIMAVKEKLDTFSLTAQLKDIAGNY